MAATRETTLGDINVGERVAPAFSVVSPARTEVALLVDTTATNISAMNPARELVRSIGKTEKIEKPADKVDWDKMYGREPPEFAEERRHMIFPAPAKYIETILRRREERAEQQKKASK
ncbi:MAG: hypothetical protein ACHQX1_00440 [Candidatus Micrarchaeales archaeon]